MAARARHAVTPHATSPRPARHAAAVVTLNHGVNAFALTLPAVACSPPPSSSSPYEINVYVRHASAAETAQPTSRRLRRSRHATPSTQSLHAAYATRYVTAACVGAREYNSRTTSNAPYEGMSEIHNVTPRWRRTHVDVTTRERKARRKRVVTPSNRGMAKQEVPPSLSRLAIVRHNGDHHASDRRRARHGNVHARPQH